MIQFHGMMHFQEYPTKIDTDIHSNPDCRTTKDFIYLTLMASWLVDLPWEGSQPFDLLDFYAGRARVSRLANSMEYEAAPKGVSIHAGRSKRSAFDINGEGGFLLLGYF